MRYSCKFFLCAILSLVILDDFCSGFAFPPSQRTCRNGPSPSSTTTTSTPSSLSASSRSMYAGKQRERSKRQERVGQFVQAELARIVHSGNIKGRDVEYLDADLRRSISLVQSDVSPDLRQARITVSVRSGAPESRKAYTWLVRNAKPLRHTLAMKMSHMKNCPELTFVQVDVSAAVDVMNLIEKISTGSYKREDLYNPESVPTGVVGGIDFADDDDEDSDDWGNEDDGGFFDDLK